MSLGCGRIMDTTIFDDPRRLLNKETRKQGIKICLAESNAFHIS